MLSSPTILTGGSEGLGVVWNWTVWIFSSLCIIVLCLVWLLWGRRRREEGRRGGRRDWRKRTQISTWHERKKNLVIGSMLSILPPCLPLTFLPYAYLPPSSPPCLSSCPCPCLPLFPFLPACAPCLLVPLPPTATIPTHPFLPYTYFSACLPYYTIYGDPSPLLSSHWFLNLFIEEEKRREIYVY